MSTIKQPAVSDNPALHNLYAIGGIATGVGIIMALIASANLDSTDPVSGGTSANSAAAVFQALGYLLAGTGLLALVGAAVAQAVNWQILNPRDDGQDKTYREYKAEHE